MSNRLRACVRAAFIGAMGCLVAASAGASTGTILVEGGGYSTPETIKLFVGLVGAGKQLCFITTASPTGSSEGSWFRPFGLTPKPILVTAENAETQAMADELSQCDGFYFDGGQPKFLSDAFLKNGRDTRALSAIRRRFSEGAPLGGSSAGAMIMGPNTLCACGLETSIKVMGGQPPEISPAFHILPVEIDAHAFVHNLYGRELVAMGQQKWPRMLVLDEGAAVVIPGDGSPWRVISNRTVALLRAPEHAAKPMTGFDISFLRPGDLIDPVAFEAITAGRKPLDLKLGGIAENLQAPTNAVLLMASSIAAGNADAFFWDSYWNPAAPLRIRLAWGEKSAAFENSSNNDRNQALLTHLTLTVEHRTREEMTAAVSVPLESRLDGDWGVPAVDGPRKDCVYHAVTPITAPGVTVANREQVKNAIAAHAVVINALPPDNAGKTGIIPGSIWLGGAGACGASGDAVDKQLAERLKALTDGDRAKPLLFYCANAMCWFSYNAAQRARHLGYSNVSWYRGGQQDWATHGGELTATANNQW